MAKTSKSKGRDLIHEAVAKKAGFALGGKSAIRNGKEASEEEVAKFIDELKTLAQRSLDPKAVTYEEVDQALGRVDAAGASKQQWLRIAFEVTGVKEKTAEKARIALRLRLTAARRIMDSQKA